MFGNSGLKDYGSATQQNLPSGNTALEVVSTLPHSLLSFLLSPSSIMGLSFSGKLTSPSFILEGGEGELEVREQARGGARRRLIGQAIMENAYSALENERNGQGAKLQGVCRQRDTSQKFIAFEPFHFSDDLDKTIT